MQDKQTHFERDTWSTIVIGGGQAGLVTGYHLLQLQEDFIILDACDATGDSWRNRWDSLKLFTPAWANGLPGMAFPGPEKDFPTKDEVADFLNAYKQKFSLPVLYNQKVTRFFKTESGFVITTGKRVFYADNVVIATGNYTIPKIPPFAGELNTSITQIHSSKYTNPAALPEGDVLVVGAGTSGLQIAIDLISAKRSVFVSGKPTFHIPDTVFKYFGKQFVWFATNVLTTSTPMGRKARYSIKTKGGGAPLINISMEDVVQAGVTHLPRLQGVKKGWPVFENGMELRVNNIIWATGSMPDQSWIHCPGVMDKNGYPLTNRGISTVVEGLYFVGSMFQYGLTSTWINGVGRDAGFVCRYINYINKHGKRKEKK